MSVLAKIFVEPQGPLSPFQRRLANQIVAGARAVHCLVVDVFLDLQGNASNPSEASGAHRPLPESREQRFHQAIARSSARMLQARHDGAQVWATVVVERVGRAKAPAHQIHVREMAAWSGARRGVGS
jgi:hypothetical protein